MMLELLLAAAQSTAVPTASPPPGPQPMLVRRQAPKAAVKKDGSRMEFKNAEEISQWLITEKLISTVPWDDAGSYLRFSVTFIAKNEEDEKRVLAEISRRLNDVKFEF